MSNNDSYSFYLHFEHLKNSLYRQLSNARKTKLFIPNYYYNWFYVAERQEYNNLCKRQQLGLSISDKEIEEFNEIKKNFKPFSYFKLTKVQKRTDDGVAFDDVYLERKHYPVYPLLALGIFSHFYLQLSRYWLAVPLLSLALLYRRDSKFQPKEEIESFYNYLIERREANELYKKQHDILAAFSDKEALKVITNELKSSNKSLEEAMNDLSVCYLNAARK